MVVGRCLEAKEVFLIKTMTRNEATLRQVLLDNVNQETTFIIDCWRGYLNIGKGEYYHATANHK